MDDRKPLSDSSYANQTQLAEREFSAFIAAVTKLFGPEQAQVSTEDWLDEAGFMDGLHLSIAGDWRAVTIAASARLANRIHAPASEAIADKAD